MRSRNYCSHSQLRAPWSVWLFLAASFCGYHFETSSGSTRDPRRAPFSFALFASAHAQAGAPAHGAPGAAPSRPEAPANTQLPGGAPVATPAPLGAAGARPGVAAPAPTPIGSPPAVPATSGSPSDNSKPAASTAGAAKASPAGSSEDNAAPTIFTGFMDPFDYEARGRRDPFAQPVPDKALVPGGIHGPLLPLQAFTVDQLRLVGIIWDVRHPKAMIKDPEGKTHIVGPNTKVGPNHGYIAAIREGELVVIETIEQNGKLTSTAQVLKIAK